MRNPKLYHISRVELPDLLLKPQLPAGSDESSVYNPESLDEPNIPRICFSETVEGCARGVFINHQAAFEAGPVDFFLYGVRPNAKAVWFDWRLLIKKRYVHDAKICLEWWATSPVKLEPLGKVTITFGHKRWLKYYPYNNPFSPKRLDHSPQLLTVVAAEEKVDG